MPRIRWSDAAFGLAFAIAFYFFLRILLPFLIPLVFSILVVALVSPLYEKIVAGLGGRKKLSSALASIGIMLAVIVPSVLVAFLLVEQAIALLSHLGESLASREAEAEGILAPLYETLDRLGLPGLLKSVATKVTSKLPSGVGPAVASLGRLVIGSFIVVIGMYYLFLDGPALFHQLMRLTPIDETYFREIASELWGVLRSLFLASFFTAIVQGLLGVAAFTLVRLPHAIAWAALMAFFSLILSLVPIVGTSLVWAPVSIWLFAQGRIAAGIFIAAWGLIVLSSVDAVVRPIVARAGGRLHPLLVLLTLFGGLGVFGPVGALLGPLVGALAAAFTRVWIRDIRPRLG